MMNRHDDNKFNGGYTMKKGLFFIVFIVFLITLVACSSNSNNDTGEGNTPSQSPSTGSNNQPAQVVLYGDIKEFPSFVPMLEKLQEDFAGIYDIQAIPVDWGNLRQVVMTGIASGQPADIYAFWPEELGSMIESEMVLELTPYLEENNGEWKNQFTSMLDSGLYGDQYYGVPISGIFPLLFANQQLLDEAGVTIPDDWNWEQFMEISQQIKDVTGVYPFGASVENALGMPRQGVHSLGASRGILDELAKLEVPGTDPLFAEMLVNIKQLDERDLWYPGAGSLTIRRDELQSAFHQGQVAMIAEASSLASRVTDNSDFDVVALPYPTMGDFLAYTGGSDGFFIPSNSQNKEAAVEILKKLTSQEYMQIHADHGFLTSHNEVEYEDEIISGLARLYDQAITKPSSFTHVDPKIQEYFRSQMLAKLFLTDGDTNEIIDEILQEIESIRLEVVADRASE